MDDVLRRERYDIAPEEVEKEFTIFASRVMLASTNKISKSDPIVYKMELRRAIKAFDDIGLCSSSVRVQRMLFEYEAEEKIAMRN